MTGNTAGSDKVVWPSLLNWIVRPVNGHKCITIIGHKVTNNLDKSLPAMEVAVYHNHRSQSHKQTGQVASRNGSSSVSQSKVTNKLDKSLPAMEVAVYHNHRSQSHKQTGQVASRNGSSSVSQSKVTNKLDKSLPAMEVAVYHNQKSQTNWKVASRNGSNSVFGYVV
ncbi:hypothetical protein J6590_055370 [Homalodisca vitripennis]|nr:hypothetical protein J6590_055370 [Homalodisca vitripennis]